MVHYNDADDILYRKSRFLSRFFRRVGGTACLCAIPGLWIAIPDSVPEARLLGLAITNMLIGASGLCLLGRR